MALPFALTHPAHAPRKTSDAAPPHLGQASHDARALGILAKTIYRELRQGGLLEEDVMSVAGELLSLVAGEVKDRRRPTDPLPGPIVGSRRSG
jgi:hypothetical protein